MTCILLHLPRMKLPLSVVQSSGCRGTAIGYSVNRLVEPLPPSTVRGTTVRVQYSTCTVSTVRTIDRIIPSWKNDQPRRRGSGTKSRYFTGVAQKNTGINEEAQFSSKTYHVHPLDNFNAAY